jgi:hypothetical protein
MVPGVTVAVTWRRVKGAVVIPRPPGGLPLAVSAVADCAVRGEQISAPDMVCSAESPSVTLPSLPEVEQAVSRTAPAPGGRWRYEGS